MVIYKRMYQDLSGLLRLNILFIFFGDGEVYPKTKL